MKRSVTIKENYEFRRLYSKGKSVVTPSLVMYCRKTNRAHNRLGVTVSTKLGHAVVRNRARRRLRELFRLSQGEMLQGYDVLLVARGKTARIHRHLRVQNLCLYAKAMLSVRKQLFPTKKSDIFRVCFAAALRRASTFCAAAAKWARS